MIKKYLLILCIGIIALSGHAKANNQKLIRYEDFVLMKYEEKQKVIKLVHDFLIEFENDGLIQQKKKANKKKYQTYLKILNFFIQSAYAQNQYDDSKINNNMSPDLKERLCYYAGWLSYVDPTTGTCTHPKNLQANLDKNWIPKKYKAYFQTIASEYKTAISNESGQGKVLKLQYDESKEKFVLEEKSSCNPTVDIVCNPKIFGSYDNKPFCVAGNKQFGLNSSLICSQAGEALKDMEDGEEKYNELMKVIADSAVAEGPDGEFFYTLRSMYETCLCGGKVEAIQDAKLRADYKNKNFFQSSINKGYAGRIFYTRTCYGIIKQTENIYEALDKNKEYVCSKTDNLGSRVNGPMADDSYTWDEYLVKLHELIKTQRYQTMIKENLSGLDLEKKYDQSALLLKKEYDQKNFEKNRQEHFEAYIEAKLCPLGLDTRDPNSNTPANNDTPADKESSLEGKCEKNCDSKEDPNATIKAWVDLTEESKDQKITITAKLNDEELEVQPNAPGQKANEFYFIVKRTDKDSKVILTAKVGDEDLGPKEIELKAFKPTGPYLDIKVEDAPGAEAKTHSIVTLTLVLPESKPASEEQPATAQSSTNSSNATSSSAQGEAQTQENSFTLKPAKAIDGHNITAIESDDKKSKKFKATKLKDEYGVIGSIKVGSGDKAKELTANGKIPPKDGNGDNPGNVEQKECSVKLALSSDDKGNNLELTYSFDGKDFPDGKTTQPEGVSTSIKWYDSVKPAEEAAPETKTKNTTAEIKTGDEEEEKEDKNKSSESTEKRKDEKPAEIKDIEENLNNVAQNNDSLSMPTGAAGSEARQVAVIISFTKDNQLVCEASDQLEIPAAGPQTNPNLNSNPVKGNFMPDRARSRGNIFQGNK